MRFKNSIELRLWGRYALFSEPITRVGGEKCSYPVPTYEAIKGVLESCYWKPTFIWYPDKLRVMHTIETESKGIRPIRYNDGTNDLSYYTYLVNVEYQIKAHFMSGTKTGPTSPGTATRTSTFSSQNGCSNAAGGATSISAPASARAI